MTDDTIFFDRRIAQKFGVSDAIIIQKIWAWVKHNAHNGYNFRDGRYWSYNSAAAYHKDLPFLSASTISSVVNRLAKAGFLLIANYNKTKFDKTSWYSFTDAGIAMMQEWGYDLEEVEPKEDQGDEASNVAPFSKNNTPFTENRNGQTENRNQYQLYNQYTKQEKKESKKDKSFLERKENEDFYNSLLSLNVDANVAMDYIKLRKAKKATNSQRAFALVERAISEVTAKLNITPTNVIEICLARGWYGCQTSYFDNIKLSDFGIGSQAVSPTSEIKQRELRYDDYGHLIKDELE